jgi:DNA-directed RNA polymerase specialized sigma24 family protein
MVSSYQKLFLSFARRRLFNHQDVEDVLQNFWEELMNGRAICNYAQQAAYQLSLRNYCLGILNRRVIDRNRQVARERRYLAPTKNPGNDPDNSPEHLLAQSDSDNLARSLVHGALIRLADQSSGDTQLIRWYLDGISYEDMARRLLGPEQTAGTVLQKKINAIKKQFTRENSGSLAKFKNVLLKLMREQGLNYDDF